jgi:aspartate carbamoyltransferase regulatory subunit
MEKTMPTTLEIREKLMGMLDGVKRVQTDGTYIEHVPMEDILKVLQYLDNQEVSADPMSALTVARISGGDLQK